MQAYSLTNNNPIPQRHTPKINIIPARPNRSNQLLPSLIFEQLTTPAPTHHARPIGCDIVPQTECTADSDRFAIRRNFGLHGGVGGVFCEENADCAGLIEERGVSEGGIEGRGTEVRT
jgi:hypothetical protein